MQIKVWLKKYKWSGFRRFDDVFSRRKSTSVKINDKIKHSADFTDNSDHDTEYDDNEPHSSPMETPISFPLVICDEGAASANVSLESDHSDVGTQNSVQEKRSRPANNKMLEHKAAKTEKTQ